MAQKQNPDDFWRNYEETTGEKVLARGLGRYVSGWSEFDSQGSKALWGLVIATSGGFRFHHFPQTTGLLGILGHGGGNVPKEKTIFVPSERIVSAVIHDETKWYRKLFSSDGPFLLIGYVDESETKMELRFSSVHSSNSSDGDIVTELTKDARNVKVAT